MRIERHDYEEYLRRFNARDYDGVFDFYTEQPQIAFFGITIRSREELKRFYGFLHAHASEAITVERFASSDDLVALEAIVRIKGLRDLSAEALAAEGYGQLNPITRGQVIEMRQMIHYDVVDGKFAAVRCAII
jgi:hypothetical protein